jgi:hypothetical protein
MVHDQLSLEYVYRVGLNVNLVIFNIILKKTKHNNTAQYLILQTYIYVSTF